ncbi:MAG: dihydrodipicolinate synthase family protein [Cyclobacteriaceae bacterium]|nr:dihydrodipicolinate synthase family protein [Cyclobacteriaceae bacterium]MDW8331702.1 dihydrodipicolinate synthase family protein [Cyclobacteriaceae bacterium]
MNWQGVFPALTTPFKPDETLDLALFERQVEAQLTAGVHGLIIGGSLGEASTLTRAEKFELVRIALNLVNGKVPVVMNIAEGSTAEAIDQAREAERLKADGLMLLPPMRYKSDERETLHFFKSVSAATALPIMVYNNPVDYKIEVTPAMFEELAGHPNIQAVKESTRDISNVTRMINRFGDRFSILCGVDTLAMEELLMGANGWVAGLVCAFPHETVALYHLIRQGQTNRALKLYRWFLPLLELDIHPKLVQYIKLAAQEAGLGTEYVRAPRLPLEGEERNRILNIIRQGLETRPSASELKV